MEGGVGGWVEEWVGLDVSRMGRVSISNPDRILEW